MITMFSILKEFGRGQITLPKKWRDQFKTNVYAARETSQGLLIVPLTDESIRIDENVLRMETGSKDSGLFKRKSIIKEE